MSKDLKELLGKIAEVLYQKTDGSCPWCSAKDYPVCGDKRGYDEVKAEDAEEWQIDHSEDCIVTYLDQALAILTEQPPAGDFREIVNNRFPVFLPDSYEGMKSLCAELTDTINEACYIIDRSEASRKELLDACRELVKFCYPDGKWRGWNNMKGILEIMQPVRRLTEKEVKK